MLSVRKCLFICFICLAFWNVAKTQPNTTDSLLKALKQSNSPAEKADIYVQIAFNYLPVNLDTLLLYADQTIAYTLDHGIDSVRAKAYICKTIAYEKQGELDEGMLVIDSAIQLLDKSSQQETRYSAYSIKAKLLRRKARYADALTYYMHCVDIAEGLKNEDLTAHALTNLGVFYMTRNELSLAESYHLKALSIREKLGQDAPLINCYENLGIVNREKKNYTEALKYYFKSLDIAIKVNDSSDIAFCYNDIGAAYSFKGNLKESEKYLKASIDIRQRLSEKDELAYTLNYLGENYERKGDLLQAEQYIKKALALAIEIGNNKQNGEALESLSDFYARHAKYDSAYHYRKIFQSYTDSLRSVDNEETIARLSTKYETNKKEKIIAQQSYDLSKKNYLLMGSASLFLVSLIIVWLAYRQYQNKQKHKLQQAVIEQQDMATKAVLQAEENERQRIAADLHDGIGQMLTAARLNLQSLVGKVSWKQEHDQVVFNNALAMVDDSCKEVRTVSHSIMPNALIKSGLGTAIKDFVEKIEQKDLTIHLHSLGLNEALDPNVELVVYRIIQESVNNVIKHSKANTLDISVIRDHEGLQVSIEDNGLGFNKADMSNSEGIGMKNIKARVEFLKGTLDIDSRPGKGTLIAFFIPLTK
ncbi:MAG: sensor histidine kinase [Chitinophagaceae bacterium]|nr:sensor histidine kinase [Chitinophagaceae bacterium]